MKKLFVLFMLTIFSINLFAITQEELDSAKNKNDEAYSKYMKQRRKNRNSRVSQRKEKRLKDEYNEANKYYMKIKKQKENEDFLASGKKYSYDDLKTAELEKDNLYKKYMNERRRNNNHKANKIFKEYKKALDLYEKIKMAKNQREWSNSTYDVADVKSLKEKRDKLYKDYFKLKREYRDRHNGKNYRQRKKVEKDFKIVKEEFSKIDEKFRKVMYDIEKQNYVKDLPPEHRIDMNPIYSMLDFSKVDKNFAIREAGNDCGQHALCTVLHYFGKKKDYKELYKEMNPAGIFSAPFDLVRFAKKNGIRANKYDDGNRNDIIAELNNKKPVIVLVTKGGQPHFMSVTGYKRDDKGNLSWILYDQFGEHVWDDKKFDERWKNPMKGIKVVDSLSSYERTYMTFDKKEEKKPRAKSNRTFLDSVASAITGIVRIFK